MPYGCFVKILNDPYPRYVYMAKFGIAETAAECLKSKMWRLYYIKAFSSTCGVQEMKEQRQYV